jgi:hypothetical protein
MIGMKFEVAEDKTVLAVAVPGALMLRLPRAWATRRHKQQGQGRRGRGCSHVALPNRLRAVRKFGSTRRQKGREIPP